MEIDAVFDAKPLSTLQVLTLPGVGFYIPAYQRDYSWQKQNIVRLFEDTCHGFNLLTEKEDAITFIGTFIVIHDTRYETVEPHIQGQLPARVMLVIDGQQRITTLLLLNTLLHSEIKYRAERLPDTENDSADKWLFQQTRSLLSLLAKTFQEDMAYGEGNYQFYPRMIRCYADAWSREQRTAVYASPISRYLHGYISHSRQNSTRFRLQVPEGVESTRAPHEHLLGSIKEMTRVLKSVAKGETEDLEIPSLRKIVDASQFQKTLLNNVVFPDDVKARLLDASGTRDPSNYQELMRLVLFARYVLERIVVTYVSVKNEAYAFDMFEALNTTGEPLTAFETFRPSVIQAEGLREYETSPSRHSMQAVENYLSVFKKAEEKQNATSNLLIPFALAESATKLSKRLSDQRRYVKDVYDTASSIEDKRLVVQHLAHTADFIDKAWKDGAQGPFSPGALPESDNAHMCLKVLLDSNHHITLGPLVRFYSNLKNAPSTDRTTRTSELADAIRAVTAFFALWRGSRLSTDNIDAHYRDLMKDGLPSSGIPPFKRRGNTGSVSAEHLRRALVEILRKGEIATKDDWVRKAKSNPVYSVSTHLARFLLFVAAHDAVSDETSAGLTTIGRPGTLEMLTRDKWQMDFTVEHVAPQTRPSSGWDDDVYSDDGAVNCLGNLTLLPRIENSAVGNRSWALKRLMYQSLSADTAVEIENHLTAGRAQGLELQTTTEAILRTARFLPHLKAIGRVQTTWNAALIDVRSNRLAEHIWDRLSPWLGIS